MIEFMAHEKLTSAPENTEKDDIVDYQFNRSKRDTIGQ